MSLQLKGLSLCAGSFALEGINLDIGRGEHVVLMGATGCGKTMLLETICGLRPATAGFIISSGDI